MVFVKLRHQRDPAPPLRRTQRVEVETVEQEQAMRRRS